MAAPEPYPGDDLPAQDDDTPAPVDLPDDAWDPAAPCPQDGPPDA